MAKFIIREFPSARHLVCEDFVTFPLSTLYRAVTGL